MTPILNKRQGEKDIVTIPIWRGKGSPVTSPQLLANHPKYRSFRTKHSQQQTKTNLSTFQTSRPSSCSPKASTSLPTATSNNSSRSRNRSNENSNKSSMLPWLNSSTHKWWVNSYHRMFKINRLPVKWISNSFRILRIWSTTNSKTPRLSKVVVSTFSNRISRTKERSLSFRSVLKVKSFNNLSRLQLGLTVHWL